MRVTVVTVIKLWQYHPQHQYYLNCLSPCLYHAHRPLSKLTLLDSHELHQQLRFNTVKSSVTPTASCADHHGAPFSSISFFFSSFYNITQLSTVLSACKHLAHPGKSEQMNGGAVVQYVGEHCHIGFKI